METLSITNRGGLPAYSALLAKVDATALSMSLAEGLVKRLVRELEENDHEKRIGKAVAKHHAMRITRFERSISAASTLLCDCGTITYYIRDHKQKDRKALFAVVGYSKGRFIFHMLRMTKHGLSVGSYAMTVSKHAVARMMFRGRLAEWREIFSEFLSMGPKVEVLATGTEPEFTVTSHSGGMGVFKREANGRPICVTWVDAVKLREVQQLANNDFALTLQQRLDDEGGSMLDVLGVDENVAKNIYRVYTKRGGILPFEEFINDAVSFTETYKNRGDV